MNEIEAIFCKLLNCDRSSLYLDEHLSLLEPGQCDRLEAILKKRLRGEPLQYLVGDTEFMGLKFKVRPGVLIPRPETETLVEEVLNEISSWQGSVAPRVLDIGTGSGNIAIALAKSLKKADIHACDISDACLVLARTNARSHGVTGRVTFHKSDLFCCFEDRDTKFDYIVSNPPYITIDDYAHLPLDVLREPSLALVAGKDGFYFYRRIEEGARRFLKAGGKIFLEIGKGQAEGIKKIFSGPKAWGEVKFVKDLCGIDRIAIVAKI